MTASLAKFFDDCLTVSAGCFTYSATVKQIESNWDGQSFHPDRRARLELAGLADRLNSFAAHLAALQNAGGRLDASAELGRFASRHVSLTSRAWAVDARCMSPMIVGPANFPVDRNRKRMNSADKAYRAITDHVSSARKSVERVAFPHGMPGDAIRASNPDAPELLRERIEELKRSHALMKTVNSAIRSVKNGDIEAMVQAVVDATGWRQSQAREIVCPREAWMGRGFPAYALSNNLAEIKRLEGRLAAIENNRDRGTISVHHDTTSGTVEVVENGEAARIQIVFPDKPDAKTRDLLKSNGFRFAPSEGAWQRHLNNNGRWAAQRVVSALQAVA